MLWWTLRSNSEEKSHVVIDTHTKKSVAAMMHSVQWRLHTATIIRERPQVNWKGQCARGHSYKFPYRENDTKGMDVGALTDRHRT